jgi:hypothetical protein
MPLANDIPGRSFWRVILAPKWAILRGIRGCQLSQIQKATEMTEVAKGLNKILGSSFTEPSFSRQDMKMALQMLLIAYEVTDEDWVFHA